MAKQVEFRIGEDEVVLADVTAPLSTLMFPLLELIVITGISWIAIGWMDTHQADPTLRNALVAFWGVLALWRFVWPVIRARRRRFVVTDRRVLARGRRGAIDSVPLHQIHTARRSKGGITLGVYGFGRPLYFEQVGKTRKVEKVLNANVGNIVRR